MHSKKKSPLGENFPIEEKLQRRQKWAVNNYTQLNYEIN